MGQRVLTRCTWRGHTCLVVVHSTHCEALPFVHLPGCIRWFRILKGERGGDTGHHFPCRNRLLLHHPAQLLLPRPLLPSPTHLLLLLLDCLHILIHILQRDTASVRHSQPPTTDLAVARWKDKQNTQTQISRQRMDCVFPLWTRSHGREWTVCFHPGLGLTAENGLCVSTLD